MVYAFLRDFLKHLKDSDFKLKLQAKLQKHWHIRSDRSPIYNSISSLKISLRRKNYAPIQEIIKNAKSLEALVQSIDVLSYKKRTLAVARRFDPIGKSSFFLLVHDRPKSIRDYILGELLAPETEREFQTETRRSLGSSFALFRAFLWYFQKIMDQPDLPFADKEGEKI